MRLSRKPGNLEVWRKDDSVSVTYTDGTEGEKEIKIRGTIARIDEDKVVLQISTPNGDYRHTLSWSWITSLEKE